MSNSPQTDSPDNGPRPGLPTAMIHKKILDAARDDPRASFTELSNDVTGASVKLVERVLENYGDPAERLVDETVQRTASDASDSQLSDGADASDSQLSDEADASDSQLSDEAKTSESPLSASADTEPVEMTTTADVSANGAVSTESAETPAVTELPEAQLETLAAIAEHPRATQRELADVIGVSCATVNRRVSAVEGLAWEDRQSFVESLFDIGEDGETAPATNGTEERIADRIGTLEPQHDDCDAGVQLDDPELVQKVLHACLESDRITDDEELEIIGAFVAKS